MDSIAQHVTEIQRLFPAMYLSFHSRRTKGRAPVSPQMMGLMHHLAMTGPLTISEMSRHLHRAQSVVSDLVKRLEQKKLLEHMKDARDRRRTLVWLTDGGQALLEREQQVLSGALLKTALERMKTEERRQLVAGMQALVHAAQQ